MEGTNSMQQQHFLLQQYQQQGQPQQGQQQQNPNQEGQNQQLQPQISNPNPSLNPIQQHQQRVNRHEQLAYQDAWRVCHPDIKRPFSSIRDACERLLPYHVLADYEAEKDDGILDPDTTGQELSRSQQWDQNIAIKIAEFTSTFEKQVSEFNIISARRSGGEFRSEERLMIKQALLREEKKAFFELMAEIEYRNRASREAAEAANMQIANRFLAEQSRLRAQTQTESVQTELARLRAQTRAEMLAQAPLRGSGIGSQADEGPMNHDMTGQEHGNMDEMIQGWGNPQRRQVERSEDFLNGESEPENGNTRTRNELREAGKIDLNAGTVP